MAQFEIDGGLLILKHNGYTIRWSDNEDCWTCSELELKNASLAKLKTAINKRDSVNRRLGDEGVPVIVLHNNMDYNTGRLGRAVLLDGDREKVWILFEPDEARRSRGFGAKDRELVSLTNVVANTPENYAKLEEHKALRQQKVALGDQMGDLIKALPKLTREELSRLTEKSDDDA